MRESLLEQPTHFLDQTFHFVVDSCAHAWEVIGPGGQLHPELFIESKGHLLLEGLLAVIIGYLLLGRSYKPSSTKKEAELSEQEIEQLCDEWTPEPLVPALPANRKMEAPIISSSAGRHVTVNGKRVINMASCDFLGIAGDPVIKDMCRATIEKYGVGSCGPRGFYGTIDVHLDLEARLAKYMGH
ncbi:hypothetical protein WJX84_004594 [Apatococcus fuscideae]|uniref:serine C-palmitoyltransferase n=1 Tax=Apatococcus fuscideae TaxID=2026836 RepID=A0AAW1TBK5_9CHLO